MNISELFDELQERFTPADLNGELTLHGNCIIWSYTPEINSEDIDEVFDSEEDDISMDFEPISCEELLQDAYLEDKERIETYLDEIDESNNWAFSDGDVVDKEISFKIF
jgi:hypothetical protein